MTKEDNVWSSILSEVRSNASAKLPSGRGVVVLGHPLSGKTTLLAKLQGIEDPKKGSGLEYSYIEVRDEYREDSTTLSMCTLDGDPAHLPLLKFPLNAASLPNTIILLTVSMATPWLILEQLGEWAGRLHDHVDALGLAAEELGRMREERVRAWAAYREEEGEGGAKWEEGEEGVLGEGVLVRNIGVEVVVVVTKTDTIGSLEKDEGYKEEQFDFIQYHVRKFCVQYGAALFYTSVKEDKNCDVLYKYLVHRSYGLAFRTPALIVEKEAVFIPAGWDNLSKISILQENMSNINPEDFFNDVIQRPRIHKQPILVEVEVEEEQKFLERQLGILNLNLNQKNNKTPQDSASSKRGSLGNSSSSSTTTPKKGEQCTDRVLANFFNSLLTSKKSPSAAANGSDC